MEKNLGGRRVFFFFFFTERLLLLIHIRKMRIKRDLPELSNRTDYFYQALLFPFTFLVSRYLFKYLLRLLRS